MPNTEQSREMYRYGVKEVPPSLERSTTRECGREDTKSTPRRINSKRPCRSTVTLRELSPVAERQNVAALVSTIAAGSYAKALMRLTRGEDPSMAVTHWLALSLAVMGWVLGQRHASSGSSCWHGEVPASSLKRLLSDTLGDSLARSA